MDKVVGIVVGMFVFAAVLIGGLAGGAEAEGIIRNALVLGWIGFFAGWFLWGKLGLSLTSFQEKQESAPVPPAEEAAKKK